MEEKLFDAPLSITKRGQLDQQVRCREREVGVTKAETGAGMTQMADLEGWEVPGGQWSILFALITSLRCQCVKTLLVLIDEITHLILEGCFYRL